MCAWELQAELAWKLRTQCRLLSNWVESYSSMCYQAAPGPSRLHNVVVVSVAGQLAHRCIATAACIKDSSISEVEHLLIHMFVIFCA